METLTQAPQTTQTSRIITVFSTVGNTEFTINSSATVWKHLRQELSASGIRLSGMKAVVGETQHTLESQEAVLPEGTFSLFLLPEKVKSGSTDDYWDPEIKSYNITNVNEALTVISEVQAQLSSLQKFLQWGVNAAPRVINSELAKKAQILAKNLEFDDNQDDEDDYDENY